MRPAIIVLAGLTLSMTLPPALAQPRPAVRGPVPPVEQPAPPPETPPPPYEPQLLRLSEILGALSVLTPLCTAGEPEGWREQMTRLIEAEATTQARRERLAGAYNRGFAGLARTYRACTPSALALIERYRSEGGWLARELTNRFGGG